MGRTQTEGNCVTSEPEVTALFDHTVPYSSLDWLKHLVEQVVEIAFLDARNECMPFLRCIFNQGAVGLPGVSDQDGVLVGRHLYARAALAAEGGEPGEAVVTTRSIHAGIS